MIFSFFKNKISINRNEISGAFGDIGTDLPILIGMILASDLNITNVFVVYGILQIITALVYGIPMPVQPLKAVAMIVITQKISSDIIFGGGLAIGFFMFIITVTGLLVVIQKYLPKAVIRGIQFGLGLQLATIAMKEYIPSDNFNGYILAIISFILILILIGSKKYPPAIFIIILGIIYSLIFSIDYNIDSFNVSLSFISFNNNVSIDNVITGFLILALPQIPLSLGNSIFATHQIITDYFPEKKVKINKIGFTYSFMNFIAPFFSGVPVCHGSGGIAGHYTFGGRTGGSTFIYGLIYLTIGLFFSDSFVSVIKVFPKPVLGVILLFEGLALLLLIKDILNQKFNLIIALLVALLANGLPYGYLIGIIVGVIVYYNTDKIFFKSFK